MTAPFSTTAPMPMSDESPIVQPWTTALWPIDTLAPMTTGLPASTWIDTLSCTLLPGPTVIESPSARRTALYQTLDPSASDTAPMTRAPAAMKADGSTCGVFPATERTEACSAIVMLRAYSPRRVSGALSCLRNARG